MQNRPTILQKGKEPASVIQQRHFFHPIGSKLLIRANWANQEEITELPAISTLVTKSQKNCIYSSTTEQSHQHPATRRVRRYKHNVRDGGSARIIWRSGWRRANHTQYVRLGGANEYSCAHNHVLPHWFLGKGSEDTSAIQRNQRAEHVGQE